MSQRISLNIPLLEKLETKIALVSTRNLKFR